MQISLKLTVIAIAAIAGCASQAMSQDAGSGPSGVGNAAKVTAPPPPGTNAAGPANATGSQLSVSAAGKGGSQSGSRKAASAFKTDPTIDAGDKEVARKIRSICRGC